MKSYLYWQINLLNISNSDKSLAETIIDYVNDDGYLVKDIFEIFDDIYKNTDKTLDELIAVQHLLQNLDPIGTCTKNIQESLLVQIQNGKYDPKLLNKASTIINEFFEELTNNKITPRHTPGTCSCANSPFFASCPPPSPSSPTSKSNGLGLGLELGLRLELELESGCRQCDM